LVPPLWGHRGVDRGGGTVTTIQVDFECCGDVLVLPTALRDDQTMLANASLIDTLLMYAEADHSSRHPECAP
jgi:hypothetical protein